jgi:hypothetical protein
VYSIKPTTTNIHVTKLAKRGGKGRAEKRTPSTQMFAVDTEAGK